MISKDIGVYSQNCEDMIVANYFNGKKGTLLDIGANDGITFSNSRYLILAKWSAYLLEPSSVCQELFDLYKDNEKVFVYNKAMFVDDAECLLMESGAHVPHGTDKALVSSLSYNETIRWRNTGVEFNNSYVQGIKWETFLADSKCKTFDFITIDCEGYEWPILEQINLSQVGCKCLCIEWNSIPTLAKQYTEYCAQFGLKEIHRNAENIIFAI